MVVVLMQCGAGEEVQEMWGPEKVGDEALYRKKKYFFGVGQKQTREERKANCYIARSAAEKTLQVGGRCAFREECFLRPRGLFR